MSEQTNPRCCPKCGKPAMLIEIWEPQTKVWAPGAAYDEDELNPGDPIQVDGRCEPCNFSWTLEDANQVDESWFTEAADAER